MAMKHHVEKVNGNSIANQFKKSMIEVINSRFGNYMLISESNRDLLLATVTLPKFKCNFVSNDAEKQLVYQILKAECYKAQPENLDSIQEESSTAVDYDDDFYLTFHQPINNRCASIESEIELEITNCSNDPRKEENILDNYKHIKRVFFKYNTTLSASAAIERIFSQSQLIFRPNRNRMSAENFERTLLIKHNKNLIS